MFKKDSIARIYFFSVSTSLIVLTWFLLNNGWAAFVQVLILVALEITFSFDNAVVNAKILEKMHRIWQQLFMTVGILIAVFGVRLFLPLVIVSLAANMSIGDVVDLALNRPEEYGDKLDYAHPMIAAFGGTFLLMIFLDFVFAERRIKWLKKIETVLAKVGKLESLSVMVALGILLTISQFVGEHERLTVITAGMIGLLTYLAINSLDTLMAGGKLEERAGNIKDSVMKAGAIGFIYLQIVDASFSLDGVIGAFAITNQILYIAVGLGIGAIFVRTMTVHMLRKKSLQKYHYMEHGAHYAIGILAAIMLLSLKYEIPEAIAGLSGVIFIVTAIVHSRVETKRSLSQSRS